MTQRRIQTMILGTHTTSELTNLLRHITLPLYSRAKKHSRDFCIEMKTLRLDRKPFCHPDSAIYEVLDHREPSADGGTSTATQTSYMKSPRACHRKYYDRVNAPRKKALYKCKLCPDFKSDYYKIVDHLTVGHRNDDGTNTCLFPGCADTCRGLDALLQHVKEKH
jgi:hypothetical protein